MRTILYIDKLNKKPRIAFGSGKIEELVLIQDCTTDSVGVIIVKGCYVRNIFGFLVLRLLTKDFIVETV